MRRSIQSALLLVCCIALAFTWGCASTARGQKQSVYQPLENLQLEGGGQSGADANIIIRYPALVDRDAETDFFDAFAAQPIGGIIKEPDPEVTGWLKP